MIAASAGNHGQAVAWAARELGIEATVFMPQDAPMAKVEATRNYGAETVLAGATFDDALAEAMARAAESGATFVHAFEDETVIAGQGTLGLELAEQLPDVETFLLPIGGGGLAAGISIALRALRPGRSHRRSAGGQEGPRHDRRRHRGQAPRRADDVDPRRAARRDRARRRRDDRRGDHAAARARRSSSSRAPGAASVAAILSGQVGDRGGSVCACSRAATSTRRC